MAGVNVAPITPAAVIVVLGDGGESKFDWVRKGRCDVTDGVSPWRRTVLPTPQSRCRLAARVRDRGGVKRVHNTLLSRAEFINVFVKFILMSAR